MKWFRSETDKKLGGICGGIAELFDVDVTIVRIVTFTLLFTPIPIVIPYLAAWFILPRKGELHARTNSGNTDTPRTSGSKNNKEFLAG